MWLARLNNQHAARSEFDPAAGNDSRTLTPRDEIDFAHFIVAVGMVDSSVRPTDGDRHGRVPRSNEPTLAVVRRLVRAADNHDGILPRRQRPRRPTSARCHRHIRLSGRATRAYLLI